MFVIVTKQNFLGDLYFGKLGEDVVKELLVKYAPKIKTVDEKGYDLKDEETWQKIEVKTDRWTPKTGNICLELWSNIALQNEGWMQYSPAEVLAYLLYDFDGPLEVDLYNFLALREYVFWIILDGDWFNSNPAIGRIVAAKQNGNINVRNLLVPRGVLNGFLIQTIPIDRGDANAG